MKKLFSKLTCIQNTNFYFDHIRYERKNNLFVNKEFNNNKVLKNYFNQIISISMMITTSQQILIVLNQKNKNIKNNNSRNTII
jgi:hypothetical protein